MEKEWWQSPEVIDNGIELEKLGFYQEALGAYLKYYEYLELKKDKNQAELDFLETTKDLLNKVERKIKHIEIGRAHV